MLIYFIRRCGILILVLSLSACTNSQKEPVKKHVIEIKDMKFIPETLHLKSGDKVVWINHDIFQHDITELKTKAWSSPILEKEASWSTVIKKSTSYFCSLHIVMRGQLIVD